MGRLVAQVPNEDPDRLKRVMDAKWRTIGVDKEALERQAKEKEDREAAERERDNNYAKLSQYFDDQLLLQQQEAEGFQRKINQDVDQFRATAQGHPTTREWDLNRPDGKRIDSPARTGDDDPRCGPSSLQKFYGEDLTAGERKKMQMAQAKEWFDTQSSEKAAMKASEAEQTAAHAEFVKFLDATQQHAKVAEDTIRRQVYSNTADENRRLAEEQRAREQAQREAELAANESEITHNLTSAMMTEDPMQATSSQSAYRVRKDHYKGMSEAEKKAILDTQLQQMEEAKARREQEQAEELMYARTQNDIFRQLNEQARRVDDFKKNQAVKAAEMLQKQNAEKQDRDKYNKDLYTNKLAPEFFGQFGTSHR